MPALDADPTLDGPARGEGFLALLADTHCVALMDGVRDAPLERDELIAHVGFEGSAFDRSMRELTDRGLIVRMAMPEDHRRKGYHLANCGRDLLAIDAALDAALAGFVVQERVSRESLMESISEPWKRAVIRVVLEAPQQFSNLLRTVHGAWRPAGAKPSQLSEATLRRRLDRLCRLGLVVRQPEAGLYAPGENIWRLGRFTALAASWRWRWTPENVPRMAGDLTGLLRMIASRVRLPEGAEIRVVLHVSAPPGMEDWPHVVVCVAADGRISLPEMTLPRADAHARATPQLWLEALLGGQFDAIEIEGESAAAHTVISGLADVLSA